MSNGRVIFIAGPTASGKSATALWLANAIGGEIVNADSMQVYHDLRILTARPSLQDQENIPHHLYGFLDGAAPFSAGRWAQAAADVIADILTRGSAAIVTGGSGLYFKALEQGLSPIPDTPPDIREQAVARRDLLGPGAFRDEVVERDPAMAHFPEGDAQRLQRAWEIFEATGKPLSYFQALPREPLIEASTEKFILEPLREKLYARCDARAATMLAEGGIEEVRALVSRKINPALPVMKALGVPEIALLLSGQATSDETLAALQQSTRRFAKRQLTWFRNQAGDWPRAETTQDVARVLFR